MNLDPLVSVIIPTFNSMTGTKNVEATLESLTKQEYQNIEILVIDNFSCDETYKICREYPVQFHKLKGTRSEARNYGLEKMRGDYVLFADSDHILPREIVGDCVSRALRFNTDCMIVPIKFLSKRKSLLDCSQMRNLEFRLGQGLRSFMLFFSKESIENIRYPKSVEFGEDMIFSSSVLKERPKISRIETAILHIEDGTVRNLILRSWNYGKAFRMTIDEAGLAEAMKIVSNLSTVNKMAKLLEIISERSIDSRIVLLKFPIYALLKHLAFGIAFFFSLLGFPKSRSE